MKREPPPRFEKARQKGSKRVHVSARGRPSLPFLPSPRPRGGVAKGGEGRALRGASFVFWPGLSHKVTAAMGLWEFGTCACLHTPCLVVRIHEEISCLEREEYNRGGRKRGRGRKKVGREGPDLWLSAAAIRQGIHGNIEHVHRVPLVCCTSYGVARPPFSPPSLLFSFFFPLSRFFLFLVRDSVTRCIQGPS